jgi:protein-L-isoaspartate(D-aspartate) O-methyltransferase
MDLYDRAAERDRMVAEQIAARGISSPEVLAAFRSVPRHVFVPADLQGLAYGDGALAIGSGQTISQPYIVALMTEKLWTTGAHAKILEIGTGSGYQAAILAQLGARVFSVDILPQLTQGAQKKLSDLEYGERVTLKTGDGFAGWAEAAPFDAVIIACAVAEIPATLIHQLQPGSRVLAPVGRSLTYQTLTLATLTPEHTWLPENLLGVVFVPMTGPHGLKKESKPEGQV